MFGILGAKFIVNRSAADVILEHITRNICEHRRKKKKDYIIIMGT